jgi:hypothetical protein
MRILILLLFPILGISQGIEPYQIQYSPYKGGFLKATISVFDEAEQDTVYYYTHADSIVTGGQEYDLIPYISGGDTIGFILYNSMDTVVFEAGDSILTGQNIFLAEGYGINIDQLDSLYTIIADTSQLATQYDLTQLASPLTFNDGTTIDFTTIGSNVTAEVKDNSIGATQLSSTTVTAGTYYNSIITVDADGRITSALDGSGTAFYSILTSDITTNSVGLTDVSDLSYTMSAEGMYRVKGLISFQSSGLSNGITFGLRLSQAATFANGFWSISIANNTTAEDNIVSRAITSIGTSSTTVTSPSVGATNSTHFAVLEIQFYNNTNSNNTLTFSVASENSGTNVKLLTNSYYTIEKIW